MKPRNPRGRPAITKGEVSTPVNVRLSATQYDQAHKRAARDRMTIPDVMRLALAKLLAATDD